ncbi:MAG: hypothetical protein IJV17_01745 [Prevotella sp.]|nr:hypothetical protein [Prevotella sp.]
MKLRLIYRRFIFAILTMLVWLPDPVLAQAQKTDTIGSHLLNEVRKYFNTDDEGAFYIAVQNYRDYHLKNGDLHLYYKGW